MPVRQEKDVCSGVRSDFRSELVGAQLHLVVGFASISQFGSKGGHIHQAVKSIFVCSVEKLSTKVFIFYLSRRKVLSISKTGDFHLPCIYKLQHPLEGVRVGIKYVHLAHLGLHHVLVQHAVKDHRPGI